MQTHRNVFISVTHTLTQYRMITKIRQAYHTRYMYVVRCHPNRPQASIRTYVLLVRLVLLLPYFPNLKAVHNLREIPRLTGT